jgi:plastocyanin
MKRLSVTLAALGLVASSCMSGGPQERTVFVDYSHDEFASIMVGYFPGEVTVAAGDTVVFKQTWTGEPHTVTGGTLVDKMMAKGKPWMDFFESFEHLAAQGGLPNPEEPEGSAADFFRAVGRAKDDRYRKQLIASYDALVKAGIPLPNRKSPGDATFAELAKTVNEESNNFFEDTGVVMAWSDEDNVTQNGGQPCFLDKGQPPKNESKACAKSKQRQPLFDGKASYYNSGIIPYEGQQGNTFRVQLSPDIEPGSYFFFCAVHGPGQSTEVKVRPQGSEIPSQEEVSRKARREIAEFAKPMLETFRDARDGKIEVEGKTIRAPFAGLSPPVFGAIDEFIPRTIRTKVGKEVTWKLMGWPHSISFDVPEYFPIIQFARNGNISLNPRLYKPVGGAPAIPEGEEGEILKVDGGTYDGSGFFSSGLMSSEPYAEYSLRFSKPGTYKYACLLHPPMVGTVEVR